MRRRHRSAARDRADGEERDPRPRGALRSVARRSRAQSRQGGAGAARGREAGALRRWRTEVDELRADLRYRQMGQASRRIRSSSGTASAPRQRRRGGGCLSGGEGRIAAARAEPPARPRRCRGRVGLRVVSPAFDSDWADPCEWVALYRDLGMQVVPCHRPAGATDATWKHPKLATRAQFATEPIPETVYEKWYGDGGEFARSRQMGMITGGASGRIVCLDLDTHKNPAAADWWQGLITVENYGHEPETWKAISGSGGRLRHADSEDSARRRRARPGRLHRARTDPPQLRPGLCLAGRLRALGVRSRDRARLARDRDRGAHPAAWRRRQWPRAHRL